MTPLYVPATLDNPATVLVWTVDECIALLVPFLLCVGLGNAPVLGVLLGAGSLWGIKRMKGDQGALFLYQFSYAYCPWLLGLRCLPLTSPTVWLG